LSAASDEIRPAMTNDLYQAYWQTNEDIDDVKWLAKLAEKYKVLFLCLHLFGVDPIFI
jgi:hypothetical protein